MTITEVSKQFDISQDTLRYYEKIGLLDTIKKNSRGVREYSEDDIKRVDFIKCMRGAGLSIEMLKRYIDLFHEGDSTIPERKEILHEQKERLQGQMSEMQRLLDKINYKIETYEEKLLKKEQAVTNINK